MQNEKTGIGPRGWAILTLVGGAALASLFVRPPQRQNSQLVDDPSAAQLAGPGRLASAQLVRDRSLKVAESVSQLDAASLSPFNGSHLAEPQLPAWATPPSPLDQLISQGTAPPWRHETAAPALEPLGAWLNGPESTGKIPATDTPHTSIGHSPSPRVPPPWPTPQPWPAVAAGYSEPRGALRHVDSQVQPTMGAASRPIGSLTGAASDELRAARPSSFAPTQAATQVAPPPATSSGTTAVDPTTATQQPPVPRPAQFVFQPGYPRQ